MHDEQQHEITVNGFVDDDARVRPAGDVMNAIGVEFAGSDSFHSNHSTVFLPRPQRSHHYLYKSSSSPCLWTVAPERIWKWRGAPARGESGGHRSGAKLLHFFSAKSTITRFGECFRNGQYMFGGFLLALLLLTVPSCAQPYAKVGGTCPHVPWSRRHCLWIRPWFSNGVPQNLSAGASHTVPPVACKIN